MSTSTAIPAVWLRWLTLVVIGVMLFGISMVLSPGLIRQGFSLLIYATPTAIDTGFGADAVAYVTLLHGVLGAVMFGWGALLLLVLRGPFRRGQQEGWNMIAISAGAWFLPDTAFSLWTGFWQNAVFNTVFAVLFMIPLAATYRAFRHAPA